MRETVVDYKGGETLRVILDAEMSKYSPEQRVAMESLNVEAKKRLAEIAQWNKHLIEKEKEMEEIEIAAGATGKVETPFKEAHGKDIDVPQKEIVAHPFKRAFDDAFHETKGNVLVAESVAAVAQVTSPLRTNSLRYTQATLAVEFNRIFKDEIMALRKAGQKRIFSRGRFSLR